MLLVICKNTGLINTLTDYYAYKVNNNLIKFSTEIPTDLCLYKKILTLDFYHDFDFIINLIDQHNIYLP